MKIKNFFGCIFVLIFVFIFVFLFFSEELGILPKSLLSEYGWNIDTYNVTANINKSGVINIKEDIYTDFSTYKHGIYRYIPLTFNPRYTTLSSDRNSYIDVEIKSILRNDLQENYESKIQRTIDTSNNNLIYKFFNETLFLKIGDADNTITGKQKYTIEYNVYGGILNIGNTSELYWNLIPQFWEVPTSKASISITSESNDFTNFSCYKGSYGENSSCDITKKKDGTLDIYETSLSEFEGITIQSKFTKQFTSNVATINNYPEILIRNWFLIIPIFPLLLIIFLYFKSGRKPKTRDIIAPRYDCPNGLSPDQAGVIIDESVDNIDISAGIIWLAIKGYLKIIKEDKDYSLQKVKDIPAEIDTIPAANKYIFTELFSSSDTIIIKDLKYKFYTKAEAAKKLIRTWAVSNKYFIRDPKAPSCSLVFAYLLYLIPIGLFFLLSSLPLYLTIFASLFVSIFFFASFNNYSKAGLELKEELLGLKLYISTAETDRIKFHNAPEKTPKLFEKLLPYAMVLGCLDIWAKQFENIYKEPPDWYVGDFRTFNTLAFANSLSSVSSSFNSTIYSVPTSSGSSGGFGGGSFGGGGFSGGGGGGGGGGSW